MDLTKDFDKKHFGRVGSVPRNEINQLDFACNPYRYLNFWILVNIKNKSKFV